MARVSAGCETLQEFAAAAAVIYAVSTVIARPRLRRIPIGIFVVFRNGVGTVAFFIATNYLYGPSTSSTWLRRFSGNGCWFTAASSS